MNEQPIDNGEPSEGFTTHMPQAGRIIPVKPDETLLAAALASGVDYQLGKSKSKMLRPTLGAVHGNTSPKWW